MELSLKDGVAVYTWVIKAGIVTIMVETRVPISTYFHNIRYGITYVSIDMQYAV